VRYFPGIFSQNELGGCATYCCPISGYCAAASSISPSLRCLDLGGLFLDQFDEVVDDVGIFQAVVGEAADVDLVGPVAAAGEADVVSRVSPGPLTTQPITDTVSGVVMCARRPSRRSTVLMTSNCWRAQEGQ